MTSLACKEQWVGDITLGKTALFVCLVFFFSGYKYKRFFGVWTSRHLVGNFVLKNWHHGWVSLFEESIIISWAESKKDWEWYQIHYMGGKTLFYGSAQYRTLLSWQLLIPCPIYLQYQPALQWRLSLWSVCRRPGFKSSISHANAVQLI